MAYLIKDINDKEIKVNDKELYGMDILGAIKSVDIKKRTLTMAGSDESQDRDGDIIRVPGWDTENYLKNPVFLWAHSYRGIESIPLAATSKLIRKKKPQPHLLFEDITFPDANFCREFFPLPQIILNLYARNILNASSVGFIPYDWNDIEDEDKKKRGKINYWYPREFTKQELLELSGCAVPCNPNALQDAIEGKGITSALKSYLADVLIGKREYEMPDNRKDDLKMEIGKIKCQFEDEYEPKQVNVPEQINDDDEKIDYSDVVKPMTNYHACRVKDPSLFKEDSFKTRRQKHDGKEYLVVWGKLKSDDSTADQSYRYNKSTWGKDEAREHCKNHKGTFEPAKEEGEESCSQCSGDTYIDEKISNLIDIMKSFDESIKNITSSVEEVKSSLKEFSEKMDTLSKFLANPDHGRPTDHQGRAQEIIDEILSSKNSAREGNMNEHIAQIKTISDDLKNLVKS